MEQTGKVIVIAGLSLTAVGGIVWLLGRFFPGLRFGRLPGDIVVERPGFTFAFPIVTMVLVSLALSLAFWIIGMLRR